MNVNIEVPDAAIISNLWNAFNHTFLASQSLPREGEAVHAFRVKALDPKTNRARWYDVSREAIGRGVALFIARRIEGTEDGYASGGWSNTVAELVEGTLDAAAADLLLQFMVWGREVYA